MDTGLPGQVPQQLRKRTPDKSGMNTTLTREQNANISFAKDFDDHDEDLDLMTKKQRQGSPEREASVGAMDNATSTGSSESGDADSSCAHVGKAVNLSLVRKTIFSTTGGKMFTDCIDCKRSPPAQSSMKNGNASGSIMSELYEFDDSLWICLRCGHAGCGRMRAAHAVAHNAAPHSDAHDLVVQTGTWKVWCYKCDDDVNVTKRTSKLKEVVDYLKKIAGLSTSRRSISTSTTAIPLPPCQPMDIPSSPTHEFTVSPLGVTSNLPMVGRTRGLRNLGNTCFFNSVMQCLGQTPYLVELLRDTQQPGQAFRLQGGQVPLSTVEQEEEDKERMKGRLKGKDIAARNSVVANPFQGELKEWGPLSKILAETLEELQSGRAEVYTPRGLLGQLSTKHPQFARGDQQDAHELLRHLLDAVREEDLKRYQEVILHKHGLNIKLNRDQIDADLRKVVKFYGSQAEILLPTLQVFKGVLVSTLQCRDCGHTSHREEFFLDLSLPINEQQPKHRRKAEELDDCRPSKYQLKKEKRAAAKMNKKAKSCNRNNATNPISDMEAMDDQIHQNNQIKSDTDSDADIEDNLEDTNSGNNRDGKSKRTKSGRRNKGAESGYNSDSRTRQSPDSGSAASPTTDGAHPASLAAQLGGSGTPNQNNHDENEEMNRPPSRLEYVPHRNDLKENLAKLTLDYSENAQYERMELDSPHEDSPQSLNSSPPSAVQDVELWSPTSPNEAAGQSSNDDDDDDESERSSAGSVYSNTPLGGRYNAADGECSVQSCLAQFTSSELMMGANAVLCTQCTRRAAGKKQYRAALKQLLIYQPPPVLILHLKRFQVHHYHSAKLSKQVSFPFLLDLASFCSRRSSGSAGNTVQYALYGVVEHSGSIHGGHYVAYVKVRPRLDRSHARWRHLPSTAPMAATLMESVGGTVEDVTSLAGRWYYVSDSHVQEVSQERVLNSQAYLLFYERLV